MRVQPHARRRLAAILALVVPLCGMPVLDALDPAPYEGVARGFPSVRDLKGEGLAEGDFAQWIERDRLHIRIRYDFGKGRSIEERAVLRQRPRLVQEQWSWREERGGRLFRRFAVDVPARRATAEKLDDDGEMERWSDRLDVEEGRAFAGIGFSLAIKSLRRQLVDGATVELQTVGFNPGPRAVTVELAYHGLDRMRMAGRLVEGERFVIHPKLPWLVDLIVDVPDATIWLTPPPAGFLRFEGPLAEPGDSIVRIDVMPGARSGPARPIRARPD